MGFCNLPQYKVAFSCPKLQAYYLWRWSCTKAVLKLKGVWGHFNGISFQMSSIYHPTGADSYYITFSSSLPSRQWEGRGTLMGWVNMDMHWKGWTERDWTSKYGTSFVRVEQPQGRPKMLTQELSLRALYFVL